MCSGWLLGSCNCATIGSCIPELLFPLTSAPVPQKEGAWSIKAWPRLQRTIAISDITWYNKKNVAYQPPYLCAPQLRMGEQRCCLAGQPVQQLAGLLHTHPDYMPCPCLDPAFLQRFIEALLWFHACSAKCNHLNRLLKPCCDCMSAPQQLSQYCPYITSGYLMMKTGLHQRTQRACLQVGR